MEPPSFLSTFKAVCCEELSDWPMWWPRSRGWRQGAARTFACSWAVDLYIILLIYGLDMLPRSYVAYTPVTYQIIKWTPRELKVPCAGSNRYNVQRSRRTKLQRCIFHLCQESRPPEHPKWKIAINTCDLTEQFDPDQLYMWRSSLWTWALDTCGSQVHC